MVTRKLAAAILLTSVASRSLAQVHVGRIRTRVRSGSPLAKPHTH
jgi:hypothetical protein